MCLRKTDRIRDLKVKCKDKGFYFALSLSLSVSVFVQCLCVCVKSRVHPYWDVLLILCHKKPSSCLMGFPFFFLDKCHTACVLSKYGLLKCMSHKRMSICRLWEDTTKGEFDWLSVIWGRTGCPILFIFIKSVVKWDSTNEGKQSTIESCVAGTLPVVLLVSVAEQEHPSW